MNESTAETIVKLPIDTVKELQNNMPRVFISPPNFFPVINKKPSIRSMLFAATLMMR